MSSHNAESAFQASDGTPLSPGYPLIYVNLGRPRVVLEWPGARIDLSWEQWSDLVADVGQRFVAVVLARPDVLENVRQVEQLAQMLMRSVAISQGERH